MPCCLSEEMGDAGYIQNMAIRPLCLHEHNNLVLSSESIKFCFLRHRMIQKMFRTVVLCQSETSSSLCPVRLSLKSITNFFEIDIFIHLEDFFTKVSDHHHNVYRRLQT